MTCHPLYQFVAAGDRATAGERYLDERISARGRVGEHIGLSNIGLDNPGFQA